MSSQRRFSPSDPFDLRMSHPRYGEVGMMLLPSEHGKLVTVESKGYENVSPSDYNVRNPLGERDATFRSLIMGMGQPHQSGEQSQRYDYAMGVDLSSGSGYLFHEAVGPMALGSGPMREVTEVTFGATRYLVILSGTRIYVSSVATLDEAADFTLLRDFAADGVEPSWAVAHQYFGGVMRLYVSMFGSDRLWAWDGSTPVTVTVSAVDPAVGVESLTSVAHGLATGQVVTMASTGTLPAPLVAGTRYYVIRVDNDTIQLATTHALSLAGTPIDLTTTGTGTRTITSSAWNVAADARAAGPAVVSRWGSASVAPFLVVGGVTNLVYQTAADPLTATGASWTQIIVGTPNHRVTWLSVVEDALLFFKEVGIFGESVYSTWLAGGTGAPTNTAVVIDALLGRDPNPEHGRNAVAWNNALWVQSAGAWLKISPRSQTTVLVESVGLERLTENTSPVRGQVVASAPHHTWHQYLGVYNQALGTSYLCKYGAWLSPESARDPQAQYIPVIHGALEVYPGRQITAMFTSTKGSASTPPHVRLYVGLDNGQLYAYDLPRFGPSAPSDPESRYRDSGYVMLSRHSLGPRTAYRGVSARGPILEPDRTVTVSYRLDEGTERELIGEFTDTGQRRDFPEELVGHCFQLKITLRGDGALLTPILDGLDLHEQLRPESVEELRFTINAAPLVRNGRGGRCLKTGRELRDWLLQVARSGEDVTLTTNEVARQIVSLGGLTTALGASNQRAPAAYVISVTAVKFRDQEIVW